jgi:general secretion pathway protein G
MTTILPFTTRRARGFTLIELLVVILIIGLLTGIVAPRFMSQISRSEVTTARAQMDAFRKAVEAFRIDNGRYPTTAEGLDALVRAPAGAARWHGPYLQSAIPPDPWGTPYQYQSPGPDGRDYQLTSLGADRAPGGSGDDADIVI